jgi:tetratricopeptide (TPR) repeat protein
VHFPASIRDLREVMRRLPPDVLGGVRKIALCLGSEHQGPGPDAPHELSPKLDPYVGRDGVEILPGVFSGRYLGTYFFDTSAIQLYAYVYDSSIPDREIRELLLRMRMLVTLMHEIAHHTEQRIRGTRGRWLAMPGNRSERYAESLEYRWARLIVVPYIEEAYRSEVQALQHWMQHHGGIGLPLLTLVEKPRVLFFAAKGALESLIEAVDERRPLKETRLEFARDLHYGEYYDEALAILAVVLADYPDDPEVQALQADIFVHLERYEDAERVAGHVLAANADDVDAWEVLLDVYRALGRWRELEAAATQVLALYEADSWQSRAAHKERAYARIELGAFEEAESDIALLSERKEARYSIIVATLRALLYLRQGCYREALRIAQTRLRTLRPRWHPILSAVRFEAAHRAQRPRDAGKLTTAEWAALRGMGYSAWVERLQESYGRNSWAHRQRP